MFNDPKTLEEAQKTRYGVTTPNPNGWPYKDGRCAYEVWNANGWGSHQCFCKNGHGINGLYCKQHAKIVSK